MKKILIFYISNTGVSENTAFYIETKLRNKNFEVDVKTFGDEIDFDLYEKAILLAPINGMKILTEMKEFILDNMSNLNELPCHFLILTYTYNRGRNLFKLLIDKDIKKLLNNSNIQAIPIGGSIEKPLPNFLKFLFGLPSNEPLDNRDFNKIDRVIDRY